MKPTLFAVRATSAEFAKRYLKPFVFGGSIAAVVLLTLGAWLTTESAWWWLLEAPLILLTLLFIVLTILAYAAVRLLAPPLTHEQKEATSLFVDKLERVSGTIGTPKLVIVYYLVRDTLRPRAGGYIETVSKDSKTLHVDFIALQTSFREGADL